MHGQNMRWHLFQTQHQATLQDQANSTMLMKKNSAQKHSANDNSIVLHMERYLEKRCLHCHSEHCDGTRCLPKNACFECGGLYHRHNCLYTFTRKMEQVGMKEPLTRTCFYGCYFQLFGYILLHFTCKHITTNHSIVSLVI